MTDENLSASDELDRSDHHKHMDYVQAVITRLANNSLLIKGWALTLSSALLGVAITQKNAGLALVAIVPVAAFWVLDTYYLLQERAFRDMYAEVAAKRLRDFTINPKPHADSQSWWGVGFSLSLRVFYLAIIVLTVVVAVILAATAAHKSPQPDPPGSNGSMNTSDEQSPPNSTVQSSQPVPPPTPIIPGPTDLPKRSVESTTTPEPTMQETPVSTHP